MEILKGIGYIVYMGMFVASLIIIWKFQFGSEGKDERGQLILKNSYMVSFPIIPIGWLLITLYNDFLGSIDYELYKWLIWILIIGAFVVQGIAIFIQKRRI